LIPAERGRGDAMARIKTRTPGMVESQVMDGVRDALRAFGLDVDRQNTAGFTNPNGQYVACGKRGNSDWSGMIPAGWGAASGKKIDIECKRGDFEPERLGSGSKARAHFDRQLERLKRTCENGGYGFWVTDVSQVVHALQRIKEGWRVTWHGDYPILTDEET
jgi:hypothetical protein